MKNVKVEFKELTRLEALSKIDENDCYDLYFAYQYYESPYSSGYVEGCMVTPHQLKIGELIKYKEYDRTRFFNKNKFNYPKEQKETLYTKPRGHKWFVKKITNDGTHLLAPAGLPRKPKKVTTVL